MKTNENLNRNRSSSVWSLASSYRREDSLQNIRIEGKEGKVQALQKEEWLLMAEMTL